MRNILTRVVSNSLYVFLILIDAISLNLFPKNPPRGVSSTVRRCVEKETGKEFACKIIDVSGDASDPDGVAIRESTLREISVLRGVVGHSFISTVQVLYNI